MQKSKDAALIKSSKMMLVFFFVSLFLLLTNLTHAGCNKRIFISDLPKCISLALKNSPMLKEKTFDIKARDKSISIAKSDFFPHIK